MDLIKYISEIENKSAEVLKKNTAMLYHEKPIYRGQASSSWKLETTLERISKADLYSLNKYIGDIGRIAPTIDCLLGSTFHDSYSPPKKQPFTEMNPMTKDEKKLLEYMSFLRQHGFPSPILDWSESPYIALYFACASEPTLNAKVHYLFRKNQTTRDLSSENIYFLDSHLKTNSRQHIQQAVYTTAMKCIAVPQITIASIDVSTHFCNTEKAVKKNRSNYDYGIIEIPAESKAALLKDLDKMDINAHALFNDTDSLMKTLAEKTNFKQSK